MAEHRLDYECACDQCLLEQMNATDPAIRTRGWEEWYRRDAPALQRYLERRCRRLHGVEHSEDLLHDCFVIGFRHISSGRYVNQGKSLRGYLYGIARYLIYELARSLHNESAYSDEALERPVAERIAIEDRIYLEEICRIVREAQARQPDLYRLVVEGIYVEGKSSDEMAYELSKTAGNIRIIACRAVNQMSRHLEHHHNVHISPLAIRSCLQTLD
jgi:RNA polymerase sigma factor (sigma-70 family)